MNCRSCGHVIADNAIVCYKCGTPTAVAAPPSTPAAKPVGRPAWAHVVLIVLFSVLAVWNLGFREPSTLFTRVIGWTAVAVVVLRLSQLLLRR